MALLAGVTALLAAGFVYQRIGAARQRRRLTPPGRMLDVGGHRLHVVCRGEGTPAVVFESAIAASSLSWSVVQPAVAEFTRACAYDRAGLGWSLRPSCLCTFERIIDDLDAVVSHAADGHPCILVGHSFGALIVRAYASRRPESVAGLVLVDPPTEWLPMTNERARLLTGGRHLATLGAMLAHLGIVRASLALLSGGAPAAPRQFVKVFGPAAAQTVERLVGEVRKLPLEVQPLVQAHWSQAKCFNAMGDYMRVLAEEHEGIGSVALSGAIPVAVISSHHQPTNQIAAHRQLAGASDHGRHVIAQRSGHWVQFDEPELVVRVIRDMRG